MFNILTLNPIAEIGLQQLPSTHYQIGSAITEPDAILVRSADMHDLPANPHIKVVGRAGAGVNNIPLERYTALGIPVLNTPGANANAVSELVIAGLLLASRNICAAWQHVKTLTLTGDALAEQVERDKKQFRGQELLGKTLAIIGLGSVGVRVANAAIDLGMQVIGFDPTISVNRAWELSANVQQAHSMNEAWRDADFVSLHIPLLTATRHLLDAKQFESMKPGVTILNFAREEVVHNADLAAALTSKYVKTYVMDFPNELKDHPQVISLPHLGASTLEAEDNCAVMIVKQVKDFLENGTILNSVNFPNIEAPPLDAANRIAIVNANVPNMVAQISARLAEAKLNIQSLINKSRDSIAYTLVDIDGTVDQDVLQSIQSIAGVINVRLLR